MATETNQWPGGLEGSYQRWVDLNEQHGHTLSMCMCRDAFEAGFEAAIEELRAVADHWEPFKEVEPGLIGSFRLIADLLDQDWCCRELSHTAPRCVERQAQLRQSEASDG